LEAFEDLVFALSLAEAENTIDATERRDNQPGR